ncbi:MAG: DUF4880 domain-containing protein [Sphingobium sp.]|nr:DUF4880 domain-containing protein [Sphingobium sp.]
MTLPPAPDAEPAESGEGAAWDRAMREAIDWTIYLDDDPDDTDLRARFEIWRIQDPLHNRVWTEASHASGLIAQTRNMALFPSTYRQSEPVEALRQVKAAFRPTQKAIMAGAVAAAVAWFAVPHVLLHIRADHITGVGQQQTFTLDDGSIVRLAPDSAVKIAYAADLRSVELLAGEAYFEVAHNPARPFNVRSDNVSVTVLGTGFDVRRGDKGTDVAVKHGRVRVASLRETSGPVILTAGQWTHMSPEGKATNGSRSTELVGSWSDKRITAVDRPLSEVLADLRRYYRGAIVVTDNKLASRSVTGTFDTANPFEAASLIVKPHGGTVRRTTPWLMIVSGS